LCYYLHQFPDFFGHERWLFYQLYYDKQECNTILNLYQSSACQTSQYHYSRYYNYNEVDCLCYYLHQYSDFIGYERWLFYQLYYDKQECKTILNLYQSCACQTSQYHYSMYYNYNEVCSISLFILLSSFIFWLHWIWEMTLLSAILW